MNDKPIVEPGFDDDDDYDEAADDAWEEAETQKRYPWLYGETDESQMGPKVSESGFGVDDDDRIVVPPKYQKQLDQARARIFAQQHFVSLNGTNYHRMHDLTDDHLPELDFLRYDNLFTARPANAYLKTPIERPARPQLFGDLWHEGELMLLFADTGLGKSVLAMQIAAALAGGKPLEPFAPNTEPQRVVYFDFELTDEQFAARYSDPDGSPPSDDEGPFPLKLIRTPPRPDPVMPDEFADHYSFLIHSIIDFVEFSGVRVIIVDNITWLAANTENTAAAGRLMRFLVDLKNRLGLSIMVIAHTPKMRFGLPVELNHLQGSKMLANFADTIIGIGRSSNGNDLRYLKPLKQRNAAMRFNEQSVPVFRLERNGRMLGFTFVDNEPEARHIQGYLRGAALTEAIRQDKMRRAVELSNAGDTVREIAEKLGISTATVSRHIQRMSVSEGQNGKNAKNADSCYTLLHSRTDQMKQKSAFLNEKEVSDEIP